MDRDNLLRRIQSLDFTIYELTLYLDTHPDCQEALDSYHKFNELRQNAVREYNEICGPLNMKQVKNRNRWTWVQSPWPWEKGAN